MSDKLNKEEKELVTDVAKQFAYDKQFLEELIRDVAIYYAEQENQTNMS